jgi:hypothetical protein
MHRKPLSEEHKRKIRESLKGRKNTWQKSKYDHYDSVGVLISRTCPKCKDNKLVAEYHKNPRRSNGLSDWCKICACSGTKAWGKKHPDEIRIQQLKFHCGGISVVEYESLAKKQNYLCALCGKSDNKRLAVDHDHDSPCIKVHGPKQMCKKCIRGLLCHRCNVNLTMIDENPGIIERIVIYRKSRPFQESNV